MGTTSSPTMLFDLANLVTQINDLDMLAALILEDEIDFVVKHMPIDKAPGPNDFNRFFLKKCWQFIKGDFYSGNANLGCINTSYITLVPKKDNPRLSVISVPFHL